MSWHVQLLLVVIAVFAFVQGDDLTADRTVGAFPEDDDLTAAISSFQEWFASHYGERNALAVRLGPAGDGMRMGVFATSKIRAESAYLSIPLKLIIDEKSIFSTRDVGAAFRRLLSTYQGPLSISKTQVCLALFLIHQRFIAKNSSFWYPYIRLLPISHDVPLFYSDAELRLLTGALIPEKIRSLRQQYKTDYETLTRSAAFRNDAATFPLHTFTLEHYMWAMGILNTRMIWWDGGPHLVPMLDMINCKEGPDAKRVHQTIRVGDAAVTQAPWTFEPGEQVFENYGQPNPTYFLYHGFVMLPNSADCASLRIDLGQIAGAHRSKLQQFGLWKDEFCVKVARNEDLIAFARVATSTDAEVRAVRGVPRHRGPLGKERAALQFIKDAVDSHLNQMSKPSDLKASDSDRKRVIDLFLTTQRGILVSAAEKLARLIDRHRGLDDPARVGREEL